MSSVADIVYYYGEDNNITGLITSDPPVIPSGYNYDYVNADALLNILVADGSQLKSTKTGTTYRILALIEIATGCRFLYFENLMFYQGKEY